MKNWNRIVFFSSFLPLAVFLYLLLANFEYMLRPFKMSIGILFIVGVVIFQALSSLCAWAAGKVDDWVSQNQFRVLLKTVLIVLALFSMSGTVAMIIFVPAVALLIESGVL